MTFTAFITEILNLFGTGGALLLALITFLVALGIYKFVKDWLPW